MIKLYGKYAKVRPSILKVRVLYVCAGLVDDLYDPCSGSFSTRDGKIVKFKYRPRWPGQGECQLESDTPPKPSAILGPMGIPSGESIGLIVKQYEARKALNDCVKILFFAGQITEYIYLPAKLWLDTPPQPTFEAAYQIIYIDTIGEKSLFKPYYLLIYIH